MNLNSWCYSIDAPISKNGSHVQLFFNSTDTSSGAALQGAGQGLQELSLNVSHQKMDLTVVFRYIQLRSANFHTTETRFFSSLTSQGPDREDGTRIESLLRTCDAPEEYHGDFVGARGGRGVLLWKSPDSIRLTSHCAWTDTVQKQVLHSCFLGKTGYLAWNLEKGGLERGAARGIALAEVSSGDLP
jgi:hypothetical protein